jgi:hypothetical protein
MIEQQLRELAVLQDAYFRTVIDKDTHQQMAKLILITYWIRKQIWTKARLIIAQISIDDFNKFDIAQVQFSQATKERFGNFQAAMLKALHENWDDGKAVWGSYLDWVSDVIEAHVWTLTSKYINVIARRVNKN